MPFESAHSGRSRFPNCVRYDISPVTSPTSTDRDIIITATTSRISHLELLVRSFVRSLWPVGSHVHFIALAPRGVDIPKYLMKKL
jgi:hypothetical protein